MALVKLISPYSKIAGVNKVVLEAASLKELIGKLIDEYGEGMATLLDDGDISPKAIFMINRRSARSLEGINTRLQEDTEVIIMEYLGWA